MNKILLVLNCSDRVRLPGDIRLALQNRFSNVSIEISRPSDISALIYDIKNARDKGYSFVAAGGGDGTIGLAASVLSGSDIPLMVLPMGTVNAFASSLGLPPDPLSALKNYDMKRIKHVDTGMAGNRFFLCFMSIGIDALSVHRMNRSIKKWAGKFAYAFSGAVSLKKMSGLSPFKIGGREFFHLILSNIKNYAGFEMFPGSSLSDGKMYYSLHDSKRIPSVLGWAHRMARGKERKVSELTCEEDLTVEFKGRLYVQFDGESVVVGEEDEEDKLVIKVNRNSLRVFY